MNREERNYYCKCIYEPSGKMTKDPIVNLVIEKYNTRSNAGMLKYGMTMAQNKSDLLVWLNHLQEELMDATLYIERLKEEIV